MCLRAEGAQLWVFWLGLARRWVAVSPPSVPVSTLGCPVAAQPDWDAADLGEIVLQTWGKRMAG